MSIRQHDFTIERRYRQRPEQTFRAFADPELRQRWFRVPESWSENEWSLDFRVGGTEVNAGRDHDGQHHLFFTEHGAFLDDLEEPGEREHGTGLLLDELAAFLDQEVPA